MSLSQVILPVIIMLIIGIICREKKLIRPKGIEGLQALVMNFTLPISLFYTFYRASIKANTVIFPVIFFVVTAGGIFAGRLLCKLVKEKDVYFPFTLTGYEAGMLGYALFGILLGNDKITQFAITCLILPHFAKMAAKTHISQIPEIHCKTGHFRANQGEIKQ